MSIATGLEIRRRHRNRQPAGFVLGILAAAVALSLSAQVVEAERSVIGWLAAALPALGFLACVKIVLTRNPATGPARTSGRVRPRTSRPHRPRYRCPYGRGQQGPPGRAVAAQDEPVLSPVPVPVDLLAAARRSVAEHQAATGKPITRDELRTVLRVSTDTATDLLRQVRTTTPTADPAAASAPAAGAGGGVVGGGAGPGRRVRPRQREPPQSGWWWRDEPGRRHQPERSQPRRLATDPRRRRGRGRGRIGCPAPARSTPSRRSLNATGCVCGRSRSAGSTPKRVRHRSSKCRAVPGSRRSASRARNATGRLRIAQIREGWHLTEEPTVPVKPPDGDVRELVKLRAHLEFEREAAVRESRYQHLPELDETIGQVEEAITATGLRGQVTPPSRTPKPRKTRSTRRRQDMGDLPRLPVERRTVGRTYTGPGRETPPAVHAAHADVAVARAGPHACPAWRLSGAVWVRAAARAA